MSNSTDHGAIEEQINQWRSSVHRYEGGSAGGLAESEAKLRAEIARLAGAGLSADEAFMVAVTRCGHGDAATREFAREYSNRVWHAQSGVVDASRELGKPARTDAIAAIALAVLAAVAVKLPALFGIHPNVDGNEGFYFRNAGLFVLPCLTGYFAWKRRLARGTAAWLAAAFVVAAVVANLPRLGAVPSFEPLTALHLPIALWLAVGIAYAGGQWSATANRMNFIRFTGELFIRYVLIALGGGVLCASIALTFRTIGVGIESFLVSWLIPCGATGALIVASWLVESKQGVMENIAPMLTKIFTPLFTAMLVVFLGTLLWSGRGVVVERERLIGFDLLLVVVLGLLLYAVSARPATARPGAFDVLQVVLLVSALLVDLVALRAIRTRIGEFGFSPNRVAALGENVILLANLAWSAVLYVRFLLRRGSFAALERWQTALLPVYSLWAVIVVVVFPLLFGPGLSAH